jgi:hypothetical protein
MCDVVLKKARLPLKCSVRTPFMETRDAFQTRWRLLHFPRSPLTRTDMVLDPGVSWHEIEAREEAR